MLDALVGPGAGPATRESFRKQLRAGELDDKEIEIECRRRRHADVRHSRPAGRADGRAQSRRYMGKASAAAHQGARATVPVRTPADRRGSRQAGRPGAATQEAIQLAESNGIVFIDEIDKVAAPRGRAGADISREGVQRDLLPLIEGTTVATKHGPVKTDHILFIASGAFHLAKPSDLLPELQGRLPIRVELKALTRDDLRRILTEPEASLMPATGRCWRPRASRWASPTTPSMRWPTPPWR